MLVAQCDGRELGRRRGPTINGIAVGSGYPTQWSATEGIVWNIRLPGWGTSAPMIWEDRIFITGCDEDRGKNRLICIGE